MITDGDHVGVNMKEKQYEKDLVQIMSYSDSECFKVHENVSFYLVCR